MRTIIAVYKGGDIADAAENLWQFDYGQKLVYEGVDLPTAYEVHFGNYPVQGGTITQIGDSTGVIIPDELLLTGLPVYVFLYLHTGTDDGETVIRTVIGVHKRPEITEQQPTPVQQDAITQAIAALNAAVESTEQSAEDAAGSATAAAGSASDAANSATAAAGSATAAQTAAQAAQTAQGGAESAKRDAETAQAAAQSSAQAAAQSAADAYRDAERAEQAATNAGYLDIEIDENGHLIYTRTDAVDVDFALVDGHLIMEAV